MSYYDAESQTYTQGWDDLYFVMFWIVIITGARVAVMDYVFRPLARAGGVESKKTEIRFAEQGWLIVYYSVFWTLGMVRASLTIIESVLHFSMTLLLTSSVSYV
jgi:acyl-CoA-dependent ceramide synthase